MRNVLVTGGSRGLGLAIDDRTLKRPGQPVVLDLERVRLRSGQPEALLQPLREVAESTRDQQRLGAERVELREHDFSAG